MKKNKNNSSTLLNNAYNKINKQILSDPSLKHDAKSAILALHESATKLWQAVENKQTEKIRPRAAAALISVFYVMRELGIDDPEECLNQKLDELKKEKTPQ